jgi:hypothetical protein
MRDAQLIVPRSLIGNNRGEMRLYHKYGDTKTRLRIEGFIPDMIRSGKNYGEYRDRYVDFELNIEDLVILRNFINCMLEAEK